MLSCGCVQERFVARYQEHIQDFWEAHGADLTAKLPSMTLDSLKYATSLVRALPCLYGIAAE